MPVKSLPRKLIRRLRKVAPRIESVHHKMKNVDSRKPEEISVEENARKYLLDMPGYRVRQMNVSRNYPKAELVIKRAHGKQNRLLSAEGTIRYVRTVVKNHNIRFSPKNYELIEPVAYPISKNLIAMAKTNAPQVNQVMTVLLSYLDLSPSKIKILKELKSRVGITETYLKFSVVNAVKETRAAQALVRKFDAEKVNLEELFTACLDVSENSGIDFNNLLVLGFRNGKFIFMPLVDEF
ncbi:MAG: hypothetical protein Q7S21_02475 [archaeon]|nr:hypothetical protein [archaeon]